MAGGNRKAIPLAVVAATMMLVIVALPAAFAQTLTENFESGLPTSAPATPTAYALASGTWTLYGAYQGGNVAYICSDGGLLDLRVLKTSVSPGGGYAISPPLQGVTSVSFKEGRGSRTITVQKSTDGGTTWTTIGTPVSTQCTLISLTVNDPAANRIKIWNASTSDEDIDNVSIVQVGAGPGLTATPSSLAFGSVVVNTTSAEQSYTLTGNSLTPASGTITVTAPSGYSISTTSGSGFTGTLAIPYTGSSLSIVVYVRFSPLALTTYPGNIVHDGGGSASLNVAVSGTGVQQVPPGIVYVAPTGNDSNAGTIDSPFRTLARAISTAGPDSTIYMRGGTYAYSSTQSINRSGTSGHPIRIWAYANEVPLLDFATQTSGDGVSLSGSYCHLRGIVMINAYHNGLNISGHYNLIENCVARDNRNSGFQMGSSSSTANPRGNIFRNCDAYRNYDAPIGGNADGFAIKWNIGTGTEFHGCRAWNNSDDGWDLWMADSSVLIDSCFAFRNGVDSWFSGQFDGNGNGFKLGGNNIATPHTTRNCVAFDNAGNTGRGFDENNNLAGQTLYNCTAYRNGGDNYHLTNTLTQGAHVVKNCVSFLGVVNITSGTRTNNSWQGFTVTSADFASLDTSLAVAPRNADGSLPSNYFMRLAGESSLIDAGVDVGIPYSGAAPDLGAFEYSGISSATSISPILISFGPVRRGSTASATVRVRNSGNAVLQIDSVRARDGEFTVTPTGSSTVASGDSALYNTSFNPTFAGSQSGALIVYSNAPTSPDSVVLLGYGTQAQWSAAPVIIAFGNVFVGSNKRDSMTVTNTGTASLTIDSVRSTNPRFQITPAGTTIAAGGSQKYYVTFSPAAAGSQSASICFYHNAISLRDSIAASGNGVASAFAVSPSTLSFGTVMVGSSAVDSVLVQNNGTGSLVISGLTSSNPTQCSIRESAPVTVAPGSSTILHITFHPTAPGSLTAAVVFVHNGSTSPDTVIVDGVGSSTLSVAVPLVVGWNMVSNPVTTDNDSVAHLFPSGVLTNVFSFTPSLGYQQQQTIVHRTGYWGNSSRDTNCTIVGTPSDVDTIHVVAGWNMIGAGAYAVDTSSVQTSPAGLRGSAYFEYAHGYLPVTSLLPGKAYWVKASGDGIFILGSLQTLRARKGMK
jgi:hypothetical protein